MRTKVTIFVIAFLSIAVVIAMLALIFGFYSSPDGLYAFQVIRFGLSGMGLLLGIELFIFTMERRKK